MAAANVRVALAPLASGRMTPTRTGVWFGARFGRRKKAGESALRGWPATGGGGRAAMGGGATGAGGLGATQDAAMPQAIAMAQRRNAARETVKDINDSLVRRQ
jgi:hypothetical protein